MTRLRCMMRRMIRRLFWILLRLVLTLSMLIFGATLYYRTTNIWALKNLGDSFTIKHMGRRPIVLSAHYRPKEENNNGNYLVLLFLADTRLTQEMYCFSNKTGQETPVATRALIQRIHEGKKAATNVCSWSGFIAECEVHTRDLSRIRISTVSDPRQAISVPMESSHRPKDEKRQDLVVCIAPMYIYTDWQIMLLGIETWLHLGASKVVVPIQSCTETAYRILKEYEKNDLIIVRSWPKWPLLSDVNPNGLILSRGIEESHVSCLHFVKPWADLVAFSDFDDMLIPSELDEIRPGANLHFLRDLFRQHPQAGSFIFEHQDVQLILPKKDVSPTVLNQFNFDFLLNTSWKSSCKLVRMKTRVIVNASRVDSINMHETGIHRFGFVQVRVPCRIAHFYHMRHSYSEISIKEQTINMSRLSNDLNCNFRQRLQTQLAKISNDTVIISSTESFANFDQCMGRINAEHWTLKVSRCLTPYVCQREYSEQTSQDRNAKCVATKGTYRFTTSGAADYVIVLDKTEFVNDEPNCEAPLPKLIGDHYFMP